MRTDTGWAERRVGLDDADGLTFGLTAPSAGFVQPGFDIAPGQIFEISEQQAAFGRDLGALIREASGAALLIDYAATGPVPATPFRP